ncbi:MAG: hypothetical protein ACRDJM_09880 [Actinomycetota bacterium]
MFGTTKRLTAALLVAAGLLLVPAAGHAATVNCTRNPVSAIVHCDKKPAPGDTVIVNWSMPRRCCLVTVAVSDVDDLGGLGLVSGKVTAVADCPDGLFAVGQQVTLGASW